MTKKEYMMMEIQIQIQTQTCDKDKPVSEILALPILKIGLPTDINKQKLITRPYGFASTQKFPQTSYKKNE